MHPSLPLTVVASLDPVLRDLTTAAVVCDVPDAVVLRYDLGSATGGRLRRVVSDLTGVLEDVTLDLEHACLGCAQREDVLPTVEAIAAGGRWEHLVLALPVGADPVPVVSAFTGDPEGRSVVVHGVLAVACAGTLTDDLFSDDLLLDRGLALTADDERSVGEALAAQLDAADLVLTDVPAAPATSAVLRHVCGPEVTTGSLDEVDGATLVAPRATAPRRVDLRCAARHDVADTDEVWTLELTSSRPLHPDRLLRRIEDLGAGRLRARGVFWLPTRPDTACAWDGAGGQLSIGDIGDWSRDRRRTTLVVTGTDPAVRERVASAFTDVLVTPEELGQDWWTPADGLEPWLGQVLADETTDVVVD